jgi:Tol biopolymer transport system component
MANRGGNYSSGLPSPDGRYIAVVGTAENKNLWMMENF